MSYITTYTGRKFYYDNITKENIHIPDILHSLPRINRFTGHSKRRYSVGEHTFLGLVMAEKLGYTALERFHWFIHDFTEAYVNDVPAPLKAFLPEFIKIEAQVEQAILDYFGLQPLTEEQFAKVKRIDMTMLVLEMRDLTQNNHEEFMDYRTYPEFLDDDDFKIGLQPLDDDLLTEILTRLFDSLIAELEL